MKTSILSKWHLESYSCAYSNMGIAFAIQRGASRSTREGRGGSVYNASCLVSIDLACSSHHSHHSHSLAAACLHREAEVEAETFLQPANIAQTVRFCQPSLHSFLCKLQGLPHINAKVQTKLAMILKTAELSYMCNSAGRSADRVSRALAFPLGPLPWWAYSWGPCPLD